ncbi:MAG: hypothetical protein ACU0CI_03320 [Shimia sp.]
MIRPALLCATLAPAAWADHAPYGGTVYTLTEMITRSDPTRFKGLIYEGADEAWLWDHDVEEDVLTDVWLYRARFTDGTDILFQASHDFDDRATAEGDLAVLAHALGQMPRACRSATARVDVNPTGGDWSAQPGAMTIDTGTLGDEIAEGAVEESMLHECVHTTFDEMFEDDPAWAAAQRADGGFISDYAEALPDGEDLAETITLYYALLYAGHRVPAEMRATIEGAIPARLAYLHKNLPKEALRP